MRRYWVNSQNIKGKEVYIQKEDFHHIVVVCRTQKGDKFEVLAGKGKSYLAEMVDVKKKSAKAHILEERKVPPLKKPYISLSLSLPRPQKMDFILEKCVELGVYDVTLFISDFSFFKSKNIPKSKKDRWERVIKSATEQSGRGELMPVKGVYSLEELLDAKDASKKYLFPYEGPCELSLGEVLKNLDHSTTTHVEVVVGSEGGFSAQEVEMFQAHGIKPFTLGETVLRSETACLALLSILKYQLDLWK